MATIQTTQVHEILCEAAGIPRGHGSSTAMARLMGVSPSRYNTGLRSQPVTANTLSRWIDRAGLPVDILISDGQVIAILRADEGEPASELADDEPSVVVRSRVRLASARLERLDAGAVAVWLEARGWSLAWMTDDEAAHTRAGRELHLPMTGGPGLARRWGAVIETVAEDLDVSPEWALGLLEQAAEVADD